MSELDKKVEELKVARIQARDLLDRLAAQKVASDERFQEENKDLIKQENEASERAALCYEKLRDVAIEAYRENPSTLEPEER